VGGTSHDARWDAEKGRSHDQEEDKMWEGPELLWLRVTGSTWLAGSVALKKQSGSL